DEAVRKDKPEHRGNEHKNNHKKGIGPVGDSGMVLVEMTHVPKRIHANQAPDNTDNKGHDYRELVDKEGGLYHDCRSGRSFKPDDQRRFDKSKRYNKVIAEFDGKTEDDYRNYYFKDKHQQVDLLGVEPV